MLCAVITLSYVLCCVLFVIPCVSESVFWMCPVGVSVCRESDCECVVCGSECDCQ